MKIITPSSSDRTSAHNPLFAQGADAIACDNPFSAGLWFTNTPDYQDKKTGTIGACQIDDTEAASTFLSQCADYLHQTHHCNTVIGPMNGNTWLQHRLILESNGRDPYLLEPIEPTHFLHTFRAAGFSILSEYSSSTIDLQSPQKDYSSMESRFMKKGVHLRPINPTQFAHDLSAIFDLSLISFSNNFLYTPLPKKTFVEKYMTSREHIDPDLVILAERDSRLVGYIFCTPDHLAKQHGKPPAVIVKTLAALPDRTLSGLGTVLVAKAQQIAKEKGYTEAIHAMQHENNSSLRISQRFNATIFRRYALMAKSFV
jgi:GNAT superfamily N-acetyltransferase